LGKLFNLFTDTHR